MPKKYFTAFCNMDNEHLRANFFHHSCLVFFEAECDEQGDIISPLYFLDAYGFYSHLIPYKKSFYEEPFTFLCQNVNINIRLRGSFGEWKQEAIHDLTYGRGLTGRLFEMNVEQFSFIQARIQEVIRTQKQFLSQAGEIIDQEEIYRSQKRAEYIKAIKNGLTHEEASKIAEEKKPLPEFKFSVTGRGNTCKQAALSLIASCYDKDQQIILDYINYLRGYTITSSIPYFTSDLDEIILHCKSNQWVPHGDKSKYPHCDWSVMEKEKESFIAISPGSWYLDKNGYMQPFFTVSPKSKSIIMALKAIGRYCELNVTDEIISTWHKVINHYLFNFATCKNQHQEQLRSTNAERYLKRLVNGEEFCQYYPQHVPANLQSLLKKVVQEYSRSFASDKSEKEAIAVGLKSSSVKDYN